MVHLLDWSPDGALIAAGGSDRRIYVFNAIDGTPYDRLEGHVEDVASIAWSPDGAIWPRRRAVRLINQGLNEISAGPDDYVRFWMLQP
jgi:WD40 repeat protein